MVIGLEELERLEDGVRADPASSLVEVSRVLSQPDTYDDPVRLRRVVLVRADGQLRLGDPQSAARAVRVVLAWAEARHEPYVLGRAHRLLAMIFGRLGDGPRSLEHATIAVERLDPSWRNGIHADHLMALAQALSICGRHSEGMTRFEEACGVARTGCDPGLLRLALNNHAFGRVNAGEGEAAARVADELMSLVDELGAGLRTEEVDTIAGAYELVGRPDDAEAMLTDVREWSRTDLGFADYDGAAMCLVRLARIQRESGRLDEARSTLDECRSFITEMRPSASADLQREMAALLAASGDYEEAFHALHAYHEERQRLESMSRADRTRSLQAILEDADGPVTTDVFGEQDARDALTGLFNGRHADERVAALLDDAADGATFTIGVITIDNFERLKEEHSPRVVDQVLVRVARIIEGHADSVSRAFAARSGSTQFLLLLPGVGTTAAITHLADIRRAVTDFAWVALSEGLTVTVSVGSATAPEDATSLQELRNVADARLEPTGNGAESRP